MFVRVKPCKSVHSKEDGRTYWGAFYGEPPEKGSVFDVKDKSYLDFLIKADLVEVLEPLESQKYKEGVEKAEETTNLIRELERKKQEDKRCKRSLV